MEDQWDDYKERSNDSAHVKRTKQGHADSGGDQDTPVELTFGVHSLSVQVFGSRCASSSNSMAKPTAFGKQAITLNMGQDPALQETPYDIEAFQM